MSSDRPILVSACLLGVNCRYDGTSNHDTQLMDSLGKKNLWPIPVCPEQLAGLTTPRPKVWFAAGDGQSLLSGAAQLVDESGIDKTAAFVRGARETLKIARACACTSAILKQRSPSCGSRQIHRRGQLVRGEGVTCALLRQAGLQVTGEDQLEVGSKSP